MTLCIANVIDEAIDVRYLSPRKVLGQTVAKVQLRKIHICSLYFKGNHVQEHLFMFRIFNSKIYTSVYLKVNYKKKEKRNEIYTHSGS